MNFGLIAAFVVILVALVVLPRRFKENNTAAATVPPVPPTPAPPAAPAPPVAAAATSTPEVAAYPDLNKPVTEQRANPTAPAPVAPPRRKPTRPGSGFPWFWVAFPITAFFIAQALNSTFPHAFDNDFGSDFGWTMYESWIPMASVVIDGFSLAWWVVAGIAGGLSAWAWIAKRV